MRKEVILIVEDDNTLREVLKEYFQETNKTVLEAEDGIIALEILSKEIPDVIILDHMMPNMNGFEFLGRVRNDSRYKYLPIIMLTAKNAVEDKVVGLELGADDYLPKPFNFAELDQRIEILLSLARNKKIADPLFNILGNWKDVEQLGQDLIIAQEIQKSLIPTSLPSFRDIKFSVFFRPTQMVGGDYFDVIRIDDRRVAFFFGDIAGKGIPAAFFMVMIRTLLRGIFRYEGKNLNLSQMAGHINHFLVQESTGGTFTTMLLGIIDEIDQTLTYTNAGHPAPILYRKDKCRFLEGGDLILGVLDDTIYSTHIFHLMSEDTFVCYTDGITEQFDGEERMFGEERLQTIIQKNAAKNFDSLAEIIYKEVMAFSALGRPDGKEKQFDDIAILTFHVE